MNARPSILMFAPLCWPPAGSESIVTAKLAVAMLEAGWGLTVITQSDFGQFYPHTGGGRLDAVENVAVSIPGRPGRRGTDVVGSSRGSAAARGVRTAGWVVRAAVRGLQEIATGRFTHLLSRAAPQYGHLPAWLVHRRAKLPWLANWSDPMPPSRAPAPYGGGPAAKGGRFSSIYCNTITRSADWHTFPCERLMRYFAGLYPWIAGKSSVVPHVGLRGPLPAARSGSVFTLCNCGRIFQRNPETFMAGVRMFVRARGDTGALRLVFVTNQEQEVRDVAARHGLEAVTAVITRAGYEQALAVAAASTVLVVLEAPVDEGVFFPSKFTDYVQTGRPILAVSPANGTLRDILGAHGGGVAVDCRSPAEVCDGVRRLYDAWRDGSLASRYGSSALMRLLGEEAVLGRCAFALERAAGHEH